MSWLRPGVLVVALVNVFFMFVGGLTYPVIPLYLTGIGLGVVWMSFIVMILSLSSFAFQVIWGWISDRIKYRAWLVVFGGSLMGVCYLLASVFYEDLIFLAILLVLANIGGAAVFTPSSALVADVCGSENVGKSMGLFWAGGSLGWALPLVFAGYLLDVYDIWVVFLICGFVSIVISVLGAVLLRLNISRSGTVKPAVRRFSLEIMLNKYFLVLYIASLLFYLGDVVKNIYIPQYHAYELGLGRGFATFILSCASWAEIPLLMVFGFLVDLLGSGFIFLFSLLSCALYLFVNSFVYDLVTALVVMTCYGFVWASFSSSSSTLTVELVGENERGIALGMLNANFSLASIIGPPLFGYLVDIYGYKLCFIFASFSLMLASIMFIIVFGLGGFLKVSKLRRN